MDIHSFRTGWLPRAAFFLAISAASTLAATINSYDSSGTLEACLSTAGVETSLPSSSTWSNDTEAWNSRLSPVPAAVIFPTTEEQVSSALQCALKTGTKVATLGGNRSFSSMGFGRNDGALVINMSNMKVLKYDENTGTLAYGGSVTISETAGFLWNGYNRALPHGRCPDVGMTGLSASGFGTLSRASGTALDNIVGARVATANGSILDVSPAMNSDLYWGRGAASSLGVVLQFHIQTLEPPSQVVTNYTISFREGYNATQQDNVNALLGIQTWALSEDNNDLVSIRLGLKKSSVMQGFYYGTAIEFADIAKTMMKNLPSTMVMATNESQCWTSEDYNTPGLHDQTITPRRYFYIAAVTIPSSTPLTNATAWQLYSSTVYAPSLPGARASGFVDIWGGTYTKTVSSDTSAWKHGNELLLVRWDIRTESFDVSWPNGTIDVMRESFYEFVDSYEAGGTSAGGFVNYRDERWDVEQTAKYLYGENWARLQGVKTAYDPGEVFNADPQAVPALKD